MKDYICTFVCVFTELKIPILKNPLTELLLITMKTKPSYCFDGSYTRVHAIAVYIFGIQFIALFHKPMLKIMIL